MDCRSRNAPTHSLGKRVAPILTGDEAVPDDAGARDPDSVTHTVLHKVAETGQGLVELSEARRRRLRGSCIEQ